MDRHLPPETLTQNIGDTDLQYLRYAGAEPTIVLLHATGFLPWLWDPIARQLAGTHRVIAPYFCDHREFDPEKGGLDWMILAQDLVALCRSLNIVSPVLVGHSMGATVMTLAEAAFGLNAAGLLLIEPIFFPEVYYKTAISVDNHPLASKSLKRRNHWDSVEEVKTYLRTKPLFAKWEDAFLDLYIEHGTTPKQETGLELTCPPPREAAIFMGGMASNPWPLLPQIQCPVLVLEGTESENRQFIDLQKAVSCFQNARFSQIAGAGHLIPMEKPAEILKIISEFTRQTQNRF